MIGFFNNRTVCRTIKKSVLFSAVLALGAFAMHASPLAETELDGVDFTRNKVGRITVYADGEREREDPAESGDYSTTPEKGSASTKASGADSSADTIDVLDSIPEGMPASPADSATAAEADSSDKTDKSKTGKDSKTDKSKGEEEPEGQVIPEPNKKKLDLNGVNRSLTQKYISQYQTKTNISWLVMCLNNSVPYRPYIQKKLRDNNMPMVLQYLPVIESNFKNTAVSSSGATGMWQFMTNSMAPMLTKNEWYDERRDPWKATDAAVRKLLDNYAMFKDWPTAIAAYNCGAGAMKKLLNANPGYGYWDLAENDLLRTETALYVAKLLAVAELIENAEYYGLLEVGVADKQIEGAEIEQYDFATVTYKADLGYISELTGIAKETLEFLNPALLKGCTPPDMEYSLRVPLGKGEEVTKIMKENAPPVTFIYTVEKGDSLWGISRRYGVTVDIICNLNEIDETAILSIGQSLVLPLIEQ